MYYARIFCSSRWVSESGSLKDVCAEAITTDLRADGNEWTVYQCGEKFDFKEKTIQRLAVQMALPLFSRIVFPLTLVFVQEEFVKRKLGQLDPDPNDNSLNFGFEHYEIRPLNYSKIDVFAEAVYDALYGNGDDSRLKFYEFELVDFLDALDYTLEDIVAFYSSCKDKKAPSKFRDALFSKFKDYKKDARFQRISAALEEFQTN